MENHILDYGGNLVSNVDLIKKETTFFFKKTIHILYSQTSS